MHSASPLHILIVDDEENVHQTLGNFLKDLGHQIDSAYDGSSALQAIRNHNYDLALVDIRMPGMDGLALVEKVVEIRPNFLSVIVTGHGNPGVAEKAIELGVLDFLMKPVKLVDLMKIVEKADRVGKEST